jgi:hypothetical protein
MLAPGADDDPVLHVVRVIGTTSYAILLLVSAIYKLFLFGVWSYVKHWTNWSWTLQTYYYAALALDLMVGKQCPRVRSHAQWVRRWIFCPINGIVWSVAIGVEILLGSGSPFLSRLLHDMSPSVVILGNETFHVFPVIAVMAVYALDYDKIDASLRPPRPSSSDGSGLWRTALFYVYQLFGGGLIPLTVYLIFFDVSDIYKTSVDDFISVTTYVLLGTLSNILPVWRAVRVADHKLGK